MDVNISLQKLDLFLFIYDSFIIPLIIPFIIQRFKDAKTIEPGPGSYNDPRHALEATKRITGLKRSPFGQTALRFSKSASDVPR